MAGDSPYIVGSVGVEVTPTGGETFFARFATQATPAAQRIGETLGARIADPIVRQVGASVGDGLERGARGLGAKGAKAGDEYGGKFGDALRRRLDAALKALPQAKLTADSSEADRKVVELRARIQALSDKRIGVDVTDAAALAELSQLRRELDELGRRSPSVTVRVNTAGAAAELAAFRAEIDKIDGSRAAAELGTVGSAADSSGRQIGWLVTAGAALGPAIVPAAALAAGAVAAIGLGAAAAVSGIGVLALGLAPVIGAVQALNNVQGKASASAVTLGARNVSLANAVDTVRSAQASLANTTANAADTQRRAAETVKTAELSLADAQRQARQAQADLTQARKDEIAAQQDLANQAIDNNLAQQRAAFDLTDAEAALGQAKAKAAAAPTAANQRAQAEAQLAFDEAKQRVAELGLQQKRLAAEQQRAAKAGVDGSARVVAAQDRVRQSTESVAKAEQSLADARLSQAAQARQSALSVAQAQQAVVTAQRAVQQASVAAGAGGSEAMQTLADKMASLSPIGQEFARFLFGLKPVLLLLSTTAQNTLLPGLETGIKILLPLVPKITGFIASMGRTLSGLAVQAATALTSPFWQQFFTYLTTQAGPALVQMTRAVGYFAAGFAGLLQAFAPVSSRIIAGLTTMAQRFAEFGTTASHNRGFQDFLAYVEHEGPIVVATISNLATTAGRLIQAVAPIGSLVLGAIRDLSAAINAIPIPVLSLLAGAIVAVIVATKAMSLADTAADVARQIWTKGIQVATTTMDSYHTSMATGTIRAGRFSGALTVMRAGASATRTAISGLVGALGGPWGIAIAAATVGIGYFIARAQQGKAQIAALSSSLQSYGDTLKDGLTPEALQSAQALLAQNDQLRGIVTASRAAGVSQEELVRGLNGDQSARANVIAAIHGHEDALYRQAYAGDVVDQKAAGQAKVLGDLRKAFEKASGANVESAALAKLLGQELDNLNTKIYGTSAAFVQAAHGAELADPKISGLIDKMRLMGDRTATVTDRVGAFRDMLQQATQAAQDQEDKLLSFRETALQSTRSINELRVNTDGLSRSDIAHAKSLNGANQAAIDQERNLTAAAKAIRDAYLADLESKVPEEQAHDRLVKRTAALEKEYTQAGFNKTRVHDLVVEYGGVPKELRTTFSQENFPQTIAGLTTLIGQIAYAQYAAGQITFQQYKSKVAQAKAEATNDLRYNPLNPNQPLGGGSGGGLATGGVIPGYTPGADVHTFHSPTAGTLALSGGEAVMRPEWTRAVGLDYINAGNDAARRGGVGGVQRFLGLAGGGVVDLPIKVNASAIAASAIRSLKGATVQQQLGAVSGGIAAIQSWIKAQAGKPYVWDSAGPSGFDCSGMVSAVYNLIKGKSPNVHTFSTSNEGSFFPLKGPGVFTAGWSHPGQRGAGPTIGHTAGNLGGLAFESRGGRGVVVGPGATPVSSFANIGHVPLAQTQQSFGQKVTDGIAGLPKAVQRWQGVASQVLSLLHQPATDMPAVLRRINFESSGRVDAVNKSDQNWRNGTPSVGLSQVISPTFRRWAGPYLHTAPFAYGVSEDPLANVFAGMNYALHRYGSIHAIDPLVRPSGYDSGGYLPPGLSINYNGTGKPEPVLTDSQWQAMMANRGEPRGGDVHNWNFRDTTLTPGKLRALNDREDVMARVGRAR